jgi:hypothetical protein
MGVSPENPVQGAPAPQGKPDLESLLGQLHTGGAQMAPAVAQAPAQPTPGV